MADLTVIGAGNWGLALAGSMARSGHRVTLWGHDADEVHALQTSRRSHRYLTAHALPSGVRATTSLSEAVEGTAGIVWTVPSMYLEAVAQRAALEWREERIVPTSALHISAVKGLEPSGRRMTQIVGDAMQADSTRLVALSGPTLAQEVAEGKLTSAVVASTGEDSATRAQEWLSTGTFRLYRSSDVVGVEMAGALKNVIALAAGMLDGLSLGHNAMGALMSRGLAEMARLGLAMGARQETFAGLAGMGDLVTTCMSPLSRNRRAGVAIALGASIPGLASGQLDGHMVAEGIPTVRSVHDIAAQTRIAMPISEAVYRTIYEGAGLAEQVTELMRRPLTAE